MRLVTWAVRFGRGDCAAAGTSFSAGKSVVPRKNCGRSSVERYHPSNLLEETKHGRNRPPFRNLLEGFVLSVQSSYLPLQHLEPICLREIQVSLSGADHRD